MEPIPEQPMTDVEIIAYAMGEDWPILHVRRQLPTKDRRRLARWLRGMPREVLDILRTFSHDHARYCEAEERERMAEALGEPMLRAIGEVFGDGAVKMFKRRIANP